jgi:hypothetical protein
VGASSDLIRLGQARDRMDRPYGVRDCSFRDPAGNMLRFNQRK